MLLSRYLTKRNYLQNLLLCTGIAGGFVVLYTNEAFHWHFFDIPCVFKALTGIPCPGCGMGRAFSAIAKGDIAGSLDYHLLAIPFILALAAAFFIAAADIFRNSNHLIRLLQRSTNRYATLIIIGILAAHWIYQLARGFE